MRFFYHNKAIDSHQAVYLDDQYSRIYRRTLYRLMH
jgi:hypothetical protein